ncbi:MAG TPA: hypothetical protein VED63_11900 [Acidimicrobiales bacterium]|nr:hypothetical protein [Acidimicrobiales bacterium]
MELITLDSCHHYWVFDIERLCYRRVPKGLGFERRMAVAEWHPYRRLDLDPNSDAFVVVLDGVETPTLRSWRHTEATCPQCDTTRTAQRGANGRALVAVG